MTYGVFSLKFIIFSLFLGLVLGGQQSLSAGVCTQQIRLLSEYNRAKKTDHRDLAAHSFVSLLLEKRDLLFLTKAQIASLKISKRILSDRTGKTPWYKKLSENISDLAWGMGPFLFRTTFGFNRMKVARELEKVSRVFDGETGKARLQVLGIEQDEYFELIRELYFQDTNGIQLALKSHQNKATIRAVFVAILLTFMGLHPADRMLYSDTLKIQEAQANNNFSIPIAKYFNQIQKDFLVFDSSKKMILLMEEAALSDAVSEKQLGRFIETRDGIKGIEEMNNLKTLFPNLETLNFKNAEELNRILVENKGRYDVIMVFLHGLGTIDKHGASYAIRGEMIIGHELLSQKLNVFESSVLKNKSSLIFVSCGAGNKVSKKIPESRETWISLTKILAGTNQVFAFASLNDLNYHPRVRDDLSTSEKEELARLWQEDQRNEKKAIPLFPSDFEKSTPDLTFADFEKKMDEILARASETVAHFFSKGVFYSQSTALILRYLVSDNLPEFSGVSGFRTYDSRTQKTTVEQISPYAFSIAIEIPQKP